MKRIAPIIAVLAVGVIPLVAQTTTEKTTDISENSDGSVTKTETRTTTFNPQIQTKMVKYFDTYKTDKYGLPPAWVTNMEVKQIPVGWRTTQIAPGVVVSEKERAYLMDAPADLISVLPDAATGVRYYVAGSNVVAMDSNYTVVDSFRIPSVKFTLDD